MARLYYQIYWDGRERDGFTPEEYAVIVKAIADSMERLERQLHQLRIMLEGDVEVKIGASRFIQVSSPSQQRTAEVWERIKAAIGENGEEKG